MEDESGERTTIETKHTHSQTRREDEEAEKGGEECKTEVGTGDEPDEDRERANRTVEDGWKKGPGPGD